MPSPAPMRHFCRTCRQNARVMRVRIATGSLRKLGTTPATFTLPPRKPKATSHPHLQASPSSLQRVDLSHSLARKPAQRSPRSAKLPEASHDAHDVVLSFRKLFRTLVLSPALARKPYTRSTPLPCPRHTVRQSVLTLPTC